MSNIIIAKFGGSSLADSSQFTKVRDIVIRDKNRRYIIPSAPGKRNNNDHKITDLLYMCYQLASHGINFEEVYSIISNRYEDICKDLNIDINIEEILFDIKTKIQQGATSDFTASRGEYLNAIILSEYLGFEFVDAKDIILFDEDNKFNLEKTKLKVKSVLEDIPNAVIPGFYGANIKGDIITFSRGGSDITGAIIASAVSSQLYENWTDVSGFYIADPRIVDNPRSIATITYKELRELSYMGAPVLHEESIFPIKSAGIPINIRNTNKPEDSGTMIVSDSHTVSNTETITGIAGKKDFTFISIEKTMMNDEKGFIRKLVSVFESNDISIEHIPSSIDSISIIVSDSEIHTKLDKVIEEIKIYCKPDSIITYSDMSLVAIVGRGMINNWGTCAKIFTTLAEKGVNIKMITQGSSELNIIIGIESKDFDKAILSIYEAFRNDK